MFERLSRAALCHGVTRLADITRLDRLSLPVWQAVRPRGRALSVHQGKAASPLGAKVGALCEALESHCAEEAPADGPCCAFEELAAAERAPELADYSRSRDLASAAPERVRWCRAEDALSGRPHFLPHDLVSLDLTARGATWSDRSSSGLGVGGTVAEAMTTSLFELVERDAVGEWQRRPFARRLEDALALDSIAYAWFRGWRERFAELGVDLLVLAPAAVVPVPTLVCWIGGREEFGNRYRSFSGSACHPDPERALFKALAEAIQSRLTFIAGVRDDILPSSYKSAEARLPEPSEGGRQRHWSSLEPSPAGWENLAARLAEAGYPQVAVKRLDSGLEGIAVTKMFVPGLGSLKRSRRWAR